MTDDTRKLQEEARRVWDKAVGYLKTVPGKVDETVRRTAETSVLRMEIVGQRRDLEQALRELGRRVYDLVKLQGEVSADEIRLAVERVTVHEDRIAEKERRIADLEAGAEPSVSPEPAERAAAADPASEPPAPEAPRPEAAARKRSTKTKTGAGPTGRRRTGGSKKTVKKTVKKKAVKKTAKKSPKRTPKKTTKKTAGSSTRKTTKD